MREYKEFEGKTLDEAIAEACSYYDVPREKLEIDILQDAKSGIFGLMGTRRAKINARRAQIETSPGKENSRRAPEKTAPEKTAPEKTAPEKTESAQVTPGEVLPDESGNTGADEAPASAPASAKAASPARERKGRSRTAAGETRESAPQESAPAKAASPDQVEEAPVADEAEDASRRRRPARQRKDAARDLDRPQSKSSAARPNRKPAAPANSDTGAIDLDADNDAEESPDALPRVSLDSLDKDELTRVSLEVVERLTGPIVGQVDYAVDFSDNRVRVSIDCGEDFALLIGRDGQTLSAIQYISSRIISRRMGATVRVQIEGGNYRERQNEKLRETALEMARKLRETGKVQYSRALSSYHRRIIHLVLQDEEDIITRSKGDGPMKRVAVMKKR